MRMRVFSGNTFRSAATAPGCDHLPEAPVPSTEYAVAMKYRIVGRRGTLGEGGDAEAEVRNASAIRAANGIRSMAVPPAGQMHRQPDCDTRQVVTATGYTAPMVRTTAFWSVLK